MAMAAIKDLNDKLKLLPSQKAYHERAPNSGSRLTVLSAAKEFLRVFGGDAEGSVALVAAAIGKGVLLQHLIPTHVARVNASTDEARRAVVHALKEDGFSRSMIQRSGLICGESIFQKCESKGVGGRPTVLTPEKKAEIAEVVEKHSESLSRKSASGSKRRGHAVYLRTLEMRKTSLFKRISGVGRSVFFNHMRRNHPEAQFRRRKTDMCEYCVSEGGVRRSLKNLFQARNLNIAFSAPAEDFESHLASAHRLPKTWREDVREKIQELKDIAIHQERARRQRAVYNNVVKEPPADSIVIDIDFKQKGHLPMKPVECSGDFYARSAYSHLGVGLYWVENGKRVHKHIDYVLPSITQDAYTVVKCLEHLFSQDFMPQFTKIQFWADVGRHFQNMELGHYILIKLAKKKKADVSVHFFAEKHGKNGRDVHFGVVSNHLSYVSCCREILTVEDIVDALQELPHTEAFVILFPRTQTYQCNVLSINLFCSVYCYSSNGRVISASVYSDTEGSGIKYRVTTSKVTRKVKVPAIATVDLTEANETLSRRHDRIKRKGEEIEKNNNKRQKIG